MKCKFPVLLLPCLLLVAVTLALTACGGQGVPPGSSGSGAINGGALSVQLTIPPPAVMTAGQQLGLVATVFNDKNNAGVTWSCTPANACGSFSPGQTGYEIDTLYTAPVAPANGPITPNLAYPVTITATSVAESSQSASATFNAAQKYAIYLPQGGWFWCNVCASYGVVGSITLDGLGNVLGGEVDWDASGGSGTLTVLPTTGTYALDATGHGTLSISLEGDFETHGITATSNSHLVIAEEDQFNGYTVGDVGSMDLQTALQPGPSFSGSQVSGGYSFTLSGYQGISSWNGSWGGIFTADGTATGSTPGNITGGIFDENLGNNGGGTGYNSEIANPAAGLPFTGTYTAPDANGRGIITLSTSPDTPGPCGAAPLPACTQYVYYIVTPEVLRLVVATNTTPAANSGSAYGQGSLATAANDTNAALTGSFIFSYHGSGDNLNFPGDASAAAGQFTTDGAGGNVTGGIMDLNVANGGAPAASVATTSIALAGSSYSISGSPRGTFTDPSGQIYSVYLTDPNLNLLDVNNPSGAGGALFLEANNTSAATPYGNAIGVMIPQADAATATPAGSYSIQLAMQSNNYSCCDFDGGFTGDFTVSTTTSGTFSGEGDFQSETSSPNQATLITGPLTGTFTADASNPGHFTGTITTTPCFPFYVPDDATPATPCGTTFNGITDPAEQVSFYLANGSQGFIVETDSIAPIFGVVEGQGTITGAAAAKRPHAQQQQHSHPKNLLQKMGEQHDRLSGQAGSGHE